MRLGKPLDPDAVARDVTTMYGQGNLEALDYRVVQQDDQYGLSLDARRNSWGPNYVRFGLNIQDDFQGNSTYNAAARFVLSEITRAGGEWVWDAQVGQTTLLSTELYLPITDTASFFFLLHIRTEAQNVFALNGQERIAEYRVRDNDYGLDFGRDFGNWGEVRTGVEHQQGAEAVRIGSPGLPTGDFETNSYFVRLAYDRLDNVNFPRRGQQATIEWRGEHASGISGNDTFDRLSFNYLAAGSAGRYTAVF